MSEACRAQAIAAVLATEPEARWRHVWVTAFKQRDGWYAALRIEVQGTVVVHVMRRSDRTRAEAMAHAYRVRREALRTGRLP